MAAFKDVLRYLRESKGLKQEELADKIGVSYAAVSNYERGKRIPKMETLESIADFFNVDMNYLLGKTTMSVEQELKGFIVARYGTVKDFAISIDMPPSTLDGVLKRGVGKANISNVIKICHALNISCDALAYGRIEPCDNAPSTATPKQHTLRSDLLQSFDMLNADGQRKVVEYADDLVFSGRYEKKSDLPALRSVGE